MAFPITLRTRNESQNLNLTPNIVLQIDGVTRLYGGVQILKIVQIGDEDLFIGDFTIGGLGEIKDQSSYISFQGGTSQTIRQNLNIDKGFGESVSSIRVAIVDKDSEITRDLLTPGAVVEDIMGRRCKLFFGFQNTAFPEDYIAIFRGTVTSADSKAGLVTFNLNSPDDKKKSEVFLKATTELTAPMGAGDTTAAVTDTTDFLLGILGPDGVTTSATNGFRTYIRIDDEVMEYNAKSGVSFSSLSRGSLSTVAASHTSGAKVDSFYRIGPTNVINIALRFMLSGINGPYLDDQDINDFFAPDAPTGSTIFFKNTFLIRDFNTQVGDFITTIGAASGANNVTDEPITAITTDDLGTTLEIAGVTFVTENDTAATIDIRSQFDVWPEGAGLSMVPDEVDITEHLLIQQRFLSSPEMDFFLKDTTEGEEFLSRQVYNPVSAFSLPRKARSSLGFQSPPIPGVDIRVLGDANVKNADKIEIKRSTTKNFYNTIIYKFEEDVLTDTFLSGSIRINTDSTSRIPIGNKSLEIESKGLRDILSGLNIAQQASADRLRIYKFGAEFIPGLKLNLRSSFNLEIGDIVIFNMDELKVSDIESGTRKGAPRLFQIDQKIFNLRNGEVTVDITDTNFDKDSRFCLMSPSSFVGPDGTTTQFNLKPSFNITRFGTNEGEKWVKYIGASIKVRDVDFVLDDDDVLDNIAGNTVFLEGALAVPAAEDDFFELAKYTSNTDTVKLVFGFMSDVTFPDGGVQYAMI